VIASGEVGVAKPDRAIFDTALDRFRATAAVSGAAYVGDRLRTDAIGAARAGLIGVWVNRTAQSPDPETAAEALELGVLEVRGLDELAPLLAARLRR